MIKKYHILVMQYFMFYIEVSINFYILMKLFCKRKYSLELNDSDN